MTAALEADGLFAAPEHPIRLPAFEGPLEVLLFLIRRDEIDIYDIPIAQVTDQYLAVLRGMEAMDLDLAGEFFVMAATLMEIKSRLLLPHEAAPEAPDADEGPDPRWELVQQLLEYRRFKEASVELGERMRIGQGMVYREVAPAEAPARPVRPLDRLDIWNAFNRVLAALANRIQVGVIEEERVTVAERMAAILAFARTRPTFTFTELLPPRPSLVFVAATFLAILELTRLGNLKLEQSAAFADIDCEVLPEVAGQRSDHSEREIPDSDEAS